MRAVTKRFSVAVLTAAKKQLFGFRCRELDRQKFGIGMGTVAEGLIGTLAAGTPEVRLARRNFDSKG